MIGKIIPEITSFFGFLKRQNIRFQCVFAGGK
jgi:hypothetical protein